MPDERSDGMNVVRLSAEKKFFPYEKPKERVDIYLVVPGHEEKGSFLDDIDLFDMGRDEQVALSDAERYGEALEESLEDVYDDELSNPIRHYIKEMGSVALLTRDGEKRYRHAH